MTRPQKMVIVGAGPVGSLAALYAAQRGYTVEVYELRPDLRDPGVASLKPTNSINLAISERGMNAMRHAGQPELLQRVLDASVPMLGRMIHGRKASGILYELTQNFDALGRNNFAIDRGALNATLLDALDALPNVKIFFNHKLTSVDFHRRKAWVEDRDWLSQSTEVGFDILLGADGAHSAVRHHMMKVSRVDYQQEYIDSLWCEFRIEPGKARVRGTSTWQISPNHLHIWPVKDSMFIAIPSTDGSFTCTLFMPAGRFAVLEADPSHIPPFFDANFPGVRDFISDASLLHSFRENPHQPLISIKCKPYHFGSSAVIIGDAAHAMAPFYGQGMNAGMEDVRVLFSMLDKHVQVRGTDECGGEGDSDDCNNPSTEAASKEHRAQALAEYSAGRWKDAHAINDLAMQNYLEMRTSQSTMYKLRKALEEFMYVNFPSLGWQTKYSLVVFSNKPYAECVRKSDRQGRLLRLFTTLVACPCLAAGVYLAWGHGRAMAELWGPAEALWQWPSVFSDHVKGLVH